VQPGPYIRLAVAICIAALIWPVDAKPRPTPGQKSPAEDLLGEARALSLKGDLAAAYQKLDAAVKTDPGFWQAIYYRAELHFEQREYESTVRDCTEILRMKSEQVVASLLRAQANTKLGRNEDCLRELDQVINHGNKKNIVPLVMAYEMRAWLRATSSDPNFRDGKEALNDAKTACKLTHNYDAQTLDTLAAAHAELGDYDSAVDAVERAIKALMISDSFNLPTEDVFQKHLALFKQHRPIRDE
jgi:tetratricopeptide (TPR) repeat protein